MVCPTSHISVSRMNHGCQPNCAYFFDPATLTQNVYAVIDIMPGEELTLGYIEYVGAGEMK